MKNLRTTIFAFGALLLAMTAVGCVSDIYEVKMDRAVFVNTTGHETVLVDVRNSSGYADFPLQEKIEAGLKAKGYNVVKRDYTGHADVELRVLVQFCGVENPDFKGDRAVSGGMLGAGVGALAGVATGGRGAAVALSALVGALFGGGAGALQEKQANKEVFTATVAMRIHQKGKSDSANIYSRVREKGITYDKAVGRVAQSIATQIVGLF